MGKSFTINDLPKEERPRKEHQGTGHRGRLRDRFLQGGIDALLDYEIVELLLTLGTPMKDCKQMAKIAIKKFGGLGDVLDASREELQQIDGIGPLNSFGIKLFQAVAERYTKERIPTKFLFDSPKAVAEYLQKSIGREKKEHFVMLHLDARNKLIKQNISIGTIDASLVHPREVFSEAITNKASSVIVAHNHPSGNTEPSESDLEITKRLVEAGKILGIEVTDHIIVTKNQFLSFQEKGLL